MPSTGSRSAARARQTPDIFEATHMPQIVRVQVSEENDSCETEEGHGD
jgi:hypothetical protein